MSTWHHRTILDIIIIWFETVIKRIVSKARRGHYVCNNMTVHCNAYGQDAVKILKTKSRQIFGTSTSKTSVKPPRDRYDKKKKKTLKELRIILLFFIQFFHGILEKMSICQEVKRPVPYPMSRYIHHTIIDILLI
jgi:hypothetical protein